MIMIFQGPVLVTKKIGRCTQLQEEPERGGVRPAGQWDPEACGGSAYYILSHPLWAWGPAAAWRPLPRELFPIRQIVLRNICPEALQLI